MIYERRSVNTRKIVVILRITETPLFIFDHILPFFRVSLRKTLYSKKLTGILSIKAMNIPIKIGESTFITMPRISSAV